MPGRLWLLLLLVFLHAPLVLLVANSFNASRFGGRWEGFTWSWYERLFAQADIWAALRLSLLLAVSASLAAMLLGTLAAWALHRYQGSRLQRLHQNLLTLLLAMPDVLMGLALLGLFVAIGLDTGFLTLWLAHVTFCTAYVALAVLGRLQDFDMTLLDAARDLGASPAQAARRVLLPLLRPGIVAGGLLAFTLSMDDYVISFFVTGPGATTLPLRVAGMIKTSRQLPVINALSTLLLAVTFLASWFAFRLNKRPAQPR